jgi:predicted Rossmann fold nucleotide-binding protein DprA/Smf involved in DNA uptake
LTAREEGFLLLTSNLGDPNRHPLTTAQARLLAQRVAAAPRIAEHRHLESRDLTAMGYSLEMAEHIVALLEDTVLLEHYLRRGQRLGCHPISRVGEEYPQTIHNRLGLDAPGCLWTRGELELLEKPAVALVGSRDLKQNNLVFAKAVGRQAARQGYVLVSGNARGADRAAQEACLEAGGLVISIVADELWKHPLRENLLYLSEEDYDSPFTVQRALSRNRCIHTLGRMVFVAQAEMKKGGTWDGTAKNLRYGWSPVACFRDGSPASLELEAMGAYLIDTDQLSDFSVLQDQISIF